MNWPFFISVILIDPKNPINITQKGSNKTIAGIKAGKNITVKIFDL
jgi:hypothetical protein